MAEMAKKTHSGIDYSIERTERKKKLTAALRVFGKFGFDEGVAGHFTARDPEHEDKFWVNPFGKSFKQMKMSDLILVDHEGSIVHGSGLLNRAAFAIHSQIHKNLPHVTAAAHTHSLCTKRLCDPLALRGVINNSGEIIEQDVIFKKSARVLCQRI